MAGGDGDGGPSVSRFNALIRLPVPVAAWDEQVLREDFGSNRLAYLRWLIDEAGWFDIFDDWTTAELIALERDDRAATAERTEGED